LSGLRLLPEGGAARVLPGGVAFFHEEEAVFGAMLDGWRAQRVGGRGVRSKTAAASIQAVERFRRHSNAFPWEWTAGMVDEWMVDLVSVRRLAPSTIRNTQLAVAQFCDYICSPHYGWVAE